MLLPTGCWYSPVLGWSDFQLSLDFQNWAHCCVDQKYFLKLIAKKTVIFPCAPAAHARRSFTFKNHKGLKIYTFLIICKYLQKQSPKRKFWIKPISTRSYFKVRFFLLGSPAALLVLSLYFSNKHLQKALCLCFQGNKQISSVFTRWFLANF